MRSFINFIIIVIVLISNISDANSKINSLLKELDKVLENGHLYTEQKEHRLNRLKIQLEQELSPEKQYDITYRIIDEYKSYMSDSALVYIHNNIRLAEECNNIEWLIRVGLQYSFVLSSSGLFIESEIVLKNINRQDIPQELLVEYFKCMELLYTNINTYQDDKQILNNYRQFMDDSRDSILFYLPEKSTERLFYEYLQANTRGDYNEAKEYISTYIQTLHPGTHEHAMKNYNMAELYRSLGETELHVEHLILAVISDVKDAVKENRALLELAMWLYDNNDIERAFNYIQYALNDANFYNARFRYFEISKVLPIITNAYQNQNKRQSNLLQILLSVTSFLFVIVLSMMLYLQKQMNALKKARQGLNETNENLEKMNYKLNHLNQELTETNLIKEEYIGYFLDLCSEYVNKLEDFRKIVNNKLAAKRFDELLRSTSSSSGKTTEIKELYTNFDKAFLNIYPGFVSSFNKLLKEEERFEIKKDELNTELRIFALIRLGITDSNKIASFLRCSVQTVYNYRSKIKRSSIAETDDIEDQIRKIGTLNI